ncbi:MAG: hypothetical protein JWL63_308 [Rhodocyclales bacterium]|nr:hypothetical protein [Rhodocyclales bacterium]
MSEAANERSIPSLLQWTLIPGLTGLIAGIFGPIALDPGFTEGFRIGIFVTGPGALVLGLALGATLRGSRLTPRLQWQILVGYVISLALATLYLCTPAPTTVGHAINAQITRCTPAAQLVETAIANQERSFVFARSAPQSGWQDEARRMTLENPGVVINLKITQRNTVLEHRKPWNKGDRSASGWHDERVMIKGSKVYFSRVAGGSCANYPLGTNTVYFVQGWPSPSRRADDLPRFLSLPVLEKVPAKYAALLR